MQRIYLKQKQRCFDTLVSFIQDQTNKNKSSKTVVNLLCWELMQFTGLETVKTGTAQDYSSRECRSSPVIYLYI